jgi:hypothetical protein
VLAPADGGATAQERPVLYFHISQPSTYEVRATLTKGQAEMPLKQWSFPKLHAGVHALTLDDSDPPLEAGVKYWWVVEVRQYSSASRNPSVRSSIVRMAITGSAPATHPADRVAQLAGAGLYYDALQELFNDPAAQAGMEGASKYRNDLRRALELRDAPLRTPGPSTNSQNSNRNPTAK